MMNLLKVIEAQNNAILAQQAELGGKLDANAFEKVTVEPKAKTTRVDIVSFIKSEYVKDSSFFSKHITESDHNSIAEAAASTSKKKDDEVTRKKKIAGEIWKKLIKPNPEWVKHYQQLKLAASGDNSLGVPDIVSNSATSVEVDEDEDFM